MSQGCGLKFPFNILKGPEARPEDIESLQFLHLHINDPVEYTIKRGAEQLHYRWPN